MKNILKIAFSFYLLLSSFYFQAQVPQKFNYQGIARDTKGNPLAKQIMSLKIIVLPTSDASEGEYEEMQSVTTNEFGLYNLQIGNGTALKGEMKTVKWETGNKYIKVMIDPAGGSNFVDAGTTQLLSVPYAIYADKAGMAKTTASSDRAGSVSTSASGTGTVNFLTKFTAANTIYNSQLFDNGTNIGIGTITPSAKLHINQNLGSVQEHFRMQNLSATGAGRFTLYSDATTNYSTFTKYGSAFAGSYAGLTGLYPFGNLLAFGNNGLAANDGLGRFLISSAGNAGISIFKGGTSKLKFHADFTTENVGIGGNAAPVSRVHLNNTDGTNMDLRLTNTTSGHTATDGMVLSQNGNTSSLINRENGELQFGSNNIVSMKLVPSGNLELTNQIKIAGGNPGTGKVLTSDSVGMASWQTIATSNQWVTNGTHIYNSNTGNVGIGTNTPTSPLHVASPFSEIRLQNTAINTSLFITAPFNGGTGGIGTNGNYELPFYTNNIERIVIKNDGKVGVGTNLPAAIFDVTGGDALINGLTLGRGNGNDTLNTTIGFKALANNLSTGVRNTSVGSRSLFSNTIGNGNTSVGYNTLLNNTSGGSNSAFGAQALENNTGGIGNTAIGSNALFINSNGQGNTATGSSALFTNTNGNSNTAIGQASLYNNNVGSLNTSSGYGSLYSNTTGNMNAAFGFEALKGNVGGNNNTAIGNAALNVNNSGNRNVGIGDSSGFLYNGHNWCTFIGSKANSSTNSLTNATAIGANAIVGASNSLVLGSVGVNVGIGISVPAFQLQLSTNSAAKPTSSTWTISSDARLKTVDGNYTRGLSDVLKLNTVKYHYTKGNARNLPTEEQGFGFVAQELQQVYPEAVKQNEDGYLSVDFHPVLVSYINAIKELNSKSEHQATELDLLKKQNESLQQQIDELKVLIKK
jgi:chaperonin cofactor prefoldin